MPSIRPRTVPRTTTEERRDERRIIETQAGPKPQIGAPTLQAVAGVGAAALDPFKDLPVGLHHPAEILAEPVLVQNSVLSVAVAAVPEPAGVRADLIGE